MTSLRTATPWEARKVHGKHCDGTGDLVQRSMIDYAIAALFLLYVALMVVWGWLLVTRNLSLGASQGFTLTVLPVIIGRHLLRGRRQRTASGHPEGARLEEPPAAQPSSSLSLALIQLRLCQHRTSRRALPHDHRDDDQSGGVVAQCYGGLHHQHKDHATA